MDGPGVEDVTEVVGLWSDESVEDSEEQDGERRTGWDEGPVERDCTVGDGWGSDPTVQDNPSESLGLERTQGTESHVMPYRHSRL